MPEYPGGYIRGGRRRPTGRWLRFTPPQFPGSAWVAPVGGAVVFLYGGQPFLQGGVSEARARQPGMMLLIALAILVGFAASAATALGLFDLEFWWELALLIVIMLLGHWLEMRALGQASSALDALASLLPDDAERVIGDGVETVSVAELAVGDVVLVRPGGRVPADGVVVDGSALLRELDLGAPDELADQVGGWKARGAAVLYMVGDDKVVGALALEDAVRPESRQAVQGLHRLGKRMMLLTGDARQVADTVGAVLMSLSTIVVALNAQLLRRLDLRPG